MTTPEDVREALTAATETPYHFGYYATPDGRVWSATGWRGHGWRELTQTPNGRGYLKVRLQLPEGRRNVPVHKIICRTFHGDAPSPAHEVRHLNGDPDDNRAANLAWGTRKENADDRERHGRTARGDRNGMRTKPERRPVGSRQGQSKLTEDGVRAIKVRLAQGEQGRSIASRFGVSEYLISKIKCGKAWTHVTV